MIASSPTHSPTARLKVAALSASAFACAAILARRALWRSISFARRASTFELLARPAPHRAPRARSRRRRRDRKIARERAHRIAHERRVLADMGDAAAGSRLLRARIPRRIAFQHDDEVGLADQRRGVEARMHRMARRQRERADVVADDRDGGAIGERRERRDARASSRIAVPSPAVMISGRSACAIQSASCAIAAGSGCAAPAPGAARSPASRRARPTAARAAAPDRPARAATSS